MSPGPCLHTPAAALTPPPPLLTLVLIVVTQITSLETLSGYSLIFLNLKNEHLNSLNNSAVQASSLGICQPFCHFSPLVPGRPWGHLRWMRFTSVMAQYRFSNQVDFAFLVLKSIQCFKRCLPIFTYLFFKPKKDTSFLKVLQEMAPGMTYICHFGELREHWFCPGCREPSSDLAALSQVVQWQANSTRGHVHTQGHHSAGLWGVALDPAGRR